jgi:hypothetical protein
MAQVKHHRAGVKGRSSFDCVEENGREQMNPLPRCSVSNEMTKSVFRVLPCPSLSDTIQYSFYREGIADSSFRTLAREAWSACEGGFSSEKGFKRSG